MLRTVKEREGVDAEADLDDTRPLAARIRPKSLDEFVGQDSVVGKNTALRRAIERGVVGSLILWGPPGVGKTTLAYIIAGKMDAALERISAVTAEAARCVPLDRILVETDCPFLAPEPYRGKRNEPAYAALVAKKIAELKGVSVEEVQNATVRNTGQVFGVKMPV